MEIGELLKENKELLCKVEALPFLKRKAFIKELLGFSKIEALERPKLFNFSPLKDISKYSNRYFESGLDSIKRGEVLPIILAGGMGMRLNFEGPKGTFPVGGKSLFYHLIKRIRSYERYGTRPMVAVMLSCKNLKATISHFKRENFIEMERVIFFVQEELPLLDSNRRWFLDGESLATAPDGSGGLVASFNKIVDLPSVKYINVVPIDNPLADPLDPVLVGFHKREKKDISIISVERERERERMGVLVESGGVRIVEYMHIKDEKRFRYLNSGLFCIDRTFLERKIDLPVYLVCKELKGKKVYKQERFLFDILPYGSAGAILYPRENVYMPLKDRGDIEKVERALEK